MKKKNQNLLPPKMVAYFGEKFCQLSNFPSHSKYLKTRSNIFKVSKHNNDSTRNFYTAKLQLVQSRSWCTTAHVTSLVYYLFQSVKFYCTIAMSISLHVVYCCYQITMGSNRDCNRDCMVYNILIIYHLNFYKKKTLPASNIKFANPQLKEYMMIQKDYYTFMLPTKIYRINLGKIL